MPQIIQVKNRKIRTIISVEQKLTYFYPNCQLSTFNCQLVKGICLFLSLIKTDEHEGDHIGIQN